MKALVAGWFSFQGMGTTAGDLMVRDVACDWLDDAGFAYDVAVVAPFTHDRGVDWRGAAPGDYDCVLFVCGPIGDGPPVNAFLEHFRDCRKVGLDLTMLQKLADEKLAEAFDYCLTAAARAKATECRLGALDALDALREEFTEAITLAAAATAPPAVSGTSAHRGVSKP